MMKTRLNARMCACVCLEEFWEGDDWLRRGEKRKGEVVFQGATLSEELWNYSQVESCCEYWCSEKEYIYVNTHWHTHTQTTLSRQLHTVCNSPVLGCWKACKLRFVAMSDCIPVFVCGHAHLACVLMFVCSSCIMFMREGKLRWTKTSRAAKGCVRCRRMWVIRWG